MNVGENKTCGNCESATRATVRGMEAFVWCTSGHAARRAGFTAVEAVYLNVSRPACEGYKRATKPLPDAVLVTEPEPRRDIAEDVPPAASVPQSALFDDETIPPWDLPSGGFERVSSNLPIRNEPARRSPPF